MKIGTEDKKKLAVLGVVGTLGLVAAVYLYNQLVVSDPPAAVPAPVTVTAPGASGTAVSSGTEAGGGSGKARPGVNVVGSATASMQLDPTLKMGPMLMTESLVYSGSGRNIFSASSVPIDIPQAIAPPRPKPLPIVVPGPVGPPPPPPIDLKFFGTATSGNGTRQAFLLHGDDVFLASAGDVVQRRYKVVSVAANSVVVEDLTNNNRQTLPLLTN